MSSKFQAVTIVTRTPGRRVDCEEVGAARRCTEHVWQRHRSRSCSREARHDWTGGNRSASNCRHAEIEVAVYVGDNEAPACTLVPMVTSEARGEANVSRGESDYSFKPYLVLGCLLLATSCHAPGAGRASVDGTGFHILGIDDAVYLGARGDPLEAACRDWKLSNREVVEFFEYSDEYPSLPYGQFYQLPCSISGSLQHGGVRWRYAIGAGGTAVWTREGQSRYWGCSDRQCEPLVLLLTDFMDP